MADASPLAVKLAQAVHEFTSNVGPIIPWNELSESDRANRCREAEIYIHVAARSGVAIADLDATPRARLTATVRDLDNRPLDRDDYASHLEARAGRGLHDERMPLLSSEEGQAVAALLDELAGVYRNEDLGRLARTLAVRINDRLGI
jgi:hypothetical protein